MTDRTFLNLIFLLFYRISSSVTAYPK